MGHELASTLFSDAFYDYVTDPTRMYSYSLANIDSGPVETLPYLEAHIIPADTFSDTLDGDHLGIEGMWQIKVYTQYGTGTLQSAQIGRELSKIYKINKVFEYDDDFSVQVISPLKCHQGIQEGTRWVVPYYFEYRSDTNVI